MKSLSRGSETPRPLSDRLMFSVQYYLQQWAEHSTLALPLRLCLTFPRAINRDTWHYLTAVYGVLLVLE